MKTAIVEKNTTGMGTCYTINCPNCDKLKLVTGIPTILMTEVCNKCHTVFKLQYDKNRTPSRAAKGQTR